MRLRNGVLTSGLLTGQKWLRHAFGTRLAAGDLGLPAASLRQIHSSLIHVVAEADRRGTAEARSQPVRRPAGDALVTATPGLALAIRTADCVPLLLADPEHRVVAAVHAGWRGALGRIAEKTVGVMRREFGADPARLLAAVGPAIHACCYEVCWDVIEEFRSQFPYAGELLRNFQEENPADVLIPRQVMADRAPLGGQPAERQRAHLDLEEGICRQLLDGGLAAGHIERGAPCTACNLDLLYSHRKEGAGARRLLAEIAIVGE